MSKILICGRGSSLEYVNHDVLKKEFDYVILMNEFNSFTKQDKVIHDFLKNKKIIQFINVTESGLDNQFLNDFNIEHIYVTRLAPDGSKSWWREHRHHRNPELFGRVCNHPSDRLEPYMHITKNTADVVLLFSILDINATDICFVGLDFYEDQYYLGHNEHDYSHNHGAKIVNAIKASQAKIASLFPNINFTYVTKSTFDPKLKNCNIVRVE